MLQNEEGVGLINKAMERLFQVIEMTLGEITEQSGELKFESQNKGQFGLNISAPYRLDMYIRLTNIGHNYANEAKLRTFIAVRTRSEFGEKGGVFRTLEFKPAFDLLSEVVWVSKDDGNRYGTDELGGHVIDALSTEIQAQSEKR